jgi:hypothetical protein
MTNLCRICRWAKRAPGVVSGQWRAEDYVCRYGHKVAEGVIFCRDFEREPGTEGEFDL